MQNICLSLAMFYSHWLALILFINNKVILHVSVISLRAHLFSYFNFSYPTPTHQGQCLDSRNAIRPKTGKPSKMADDNKAPDERFDLLGQTIEQFVETTRQIGIIVSDFQPGSQGVLNQKM